MEDGLGASIVDFIKGVNLRIVVDLVHGHPSTILAKDSSHHSFMSQEEISTFTCLSWPI